MLDTISENKNYDTSDTIVVCGAPRTGTTWLAEVLNCIPDSTILWEPLHVLQVPEVSETGLSWRTEIQQNSSWPEAEELFRKILSGELQNKWTMSRSRHRKDEYTKHWIVKFVRANRLLRWLCDNFSTRPPILLVRHPCAVVASTLRTTWAKQQNFRGITENWCEDYARLLGLDIPHPWKLVCYEHLAKQPQKQFENIFKAIGVEIPNSYMDFVNNPSSTVFKNTALANDLDPLSQWQSDLSVAEISEILHITRSYGITLYNKSVEPDLSVFQALIGRNN